MSPPAIMKEDPKPPAGDNKPSPSSPQQQQQGVQKPPTLPPNVSIFAPKSPSAATALLNGRIFTRLAVNNSSHVAVIPPALVDSALCHGSAVLVFDAERDAHHEHVRAVCLALRDADASLSIAGCVFDAPDALRAGFQFDRLSDGAVMVVDLMGDDEDDDDDDGLEGLLKGAEAVG